MTIFSAIATGLFVIAVAWLARPLWRRSPRLRDRSTSGLVDDLAQQLRQLKRLHEAGALSDEHFEASRKVVERKVIDAVSDSVVPLADSPQRPSTWLVAGTTTFVLTVAIGGYAWFGSPRHLVDAIASSDSARGVALEPPQGAESGPHALTGDEMAAMTSRLSERLKGNADDAEGWQILARSYVSIGKHVESIEAFRHATALRPDDASLLADFADALAVTKGHDLGGEPLALVTRALSLEPKNVKALALAGTEAFNRRDYTVAVDFWSKAVESEPDAPLAEQLRNGVAEARQLAAVVPVQNAVPARAAVGAQVSGTVILLEAFRGKVSPEDTLFVFARAVDGPRMPLSILRKRVRDLPLHFTLDDSLAMSPEARISTVARVVVGARVSKSGNAMPQPGDLQGFAAESPVGASGVRILIDQMVPQ